MIEHLYIHIPFCPNICPYCAFYKESAGRERVEAFIDALLVEAKFHAPTLRPRTLFFGGGTPSALSFSQMERLLEGLHACLNLSAVEEWTIEMNPATVALDKAHLLLAAGINRISMGVQSWDDTLLKALGRTHSAAKAEESFHLLREAGFQNISLDLIFGIPNQSLASWQATLEHTLRLNPEHISAYGLTYEEGTEFFRLRKQGIMKANEHLEADQFELATDLLEQHGYRHYEISNYAKQSRESAHNMAYWLGRDYLGLGPSAFSTVAGRRWRNICETGLYSSSTMSGKTAIDFEEQLSPQLLAIERAAFGLRTYHGLLFEKARPWQKAMEEMEQHGLLYRTSDRWLLTRRGKLLADVVGEIFM
ncbi:MAG: radical SAM family heme chaperone HemW [Chthoniobacterales bacterium]|nr:radical SAM family heme chaperone HemW [Chthoniobacterales bacterium]